MADRRSTVSMAGVHFRIEVTNNESHLITTIITMG